MGSEVLVSRILEEAFLSLTLPVASPELIPTLDLEKLARKKKSVVKD